MDCVYRLLFCLIIHYVIDWWLILVRTCITVFSIENKLTRSAIVVKERSSSDDTLNWTLWYHWALVGVDFWLFYIFEANYKSGIWYPTILITGSKNDQPCTLSRGPPGNSMIWGKGRLARNHNQPYLTPPRFPPVIESFATQPQAFPSWALTHVSSRYTTGLLSVLFTLIGWR